MHIVELVSLVEDMNTLVAAGVPQEVVRLSVTCHALLLLSLVIPVLSSAWGWVVVCHPWLIDALLLTFGLGPSSMWVVLQRVSEKLSPWNRALYEFLPPLIRKQLLTEREIRGKLQLSQVSGASGMSPVCADPTSMYLLALPRPPLPLPSPTPPPSLHFFVCVPGVDGDPPG